MNMIGPGTTTASEVVPPVGFTAPIGSTSGEVPLTVLFSGLTLPAGTYYLVLTAPFVPNITGSPLAWQIATEPDIITAPSVTIGNTDLANTFNTTVEPFAPASLFVTSTDRPLFDVVSSVAEPPSTALLLISLAVLMFGRRRIRRSLLRPPPDTAKIS